MSQFIAHSGSVEMGRAQIAALTTPAPLGRVHRPVPHIDLVDSLLRVIDENHFTPIQERYSVNEKNADIFGVIDITSEDGTLGDEAITTSIGFRSNNLQKRPVAFVAGARVFVCDNLCFFGEFEVLKKKHTINLNLLSEIRNAFDSFIEQAFANRKIVGEFQNRELGTNEAKCFIFDAFAQSVFPIKCFDDVVGEYFTDTPRHPEFAPRTAWSLIQSFTEVAKQLKTNPRQDALARLGVFQRRLIS